jgi:hypothetical protein
MSLILRLRSAAVNWPTRGIFEQSALKIRATARKWIVLRSLSAAGRLGSKLQRHKKEAARLFEVAPTQMRAFYALMVAAKEGGVSPRDKERIAPAIAIAMRWEGCVLHHVGASAPSWSAARRSDPVTMFGASRLMPICRIGMALAHGLDLCGRRSSAFNFLRRWCRG